MSRGGGRQLVSDASTVLSLFWGRGDVTWPSENREQDRCGTTMRRRDWLDNGQIQQEERLPGDVSLSAGATVPVSRL